MFNDLKNISRFFIVVAIMIAFPLVTFAQQERFVDPQPEPTLYGEEVKDGEKMVEEVGPVGESREEKAEIEEAVEEEDEEVLVETPGSAKEMKGQQEPRGEGVTRRSRVANAVQAMLQVAERNEGIGNQVREIAREQNRVHEEMELGLEVLKERKAWVKFFIGPKYSKVKEVEEILNKHMEQLGELKELRAQVKNEGDAEFLQEQLKVMEEVASEMKEQVAEAKKGFSLFGWFNRWLSNR